MYQRSKNCVAKRVRLWGRPRDGARDTDGRFHKSTLCVLGSSSLAWLIRSILRYHVQESTETSALHLNLMQGGLRHRREGCLCFEMSAQYMSACGSLVEHTADCGNVSNES